MRVYKVLPNLTKERHLKIWHKALRSQWSATDLKWDTPQRITQRHLKDQMGRIFFCLTAGKIVIGVKACKARGGQNR